MRGLIGAQSGYNHVFIRYMCTAERYRRNGHSHSTDRWSSDAIQKLIELCAQVLDIKLALKG